MQNTMTFHLGGSLCLQFLFFLHLSSLSSHSSHIHPPPIFILLPYSSSSHIHPPPIFILILNSLHLTPSPPNSLPSSPFIPLGFRELKIKCIQPKALQNFFSGKICTKDSPHLFVLSLKKVCAWMYVDIITSTQHCSCIYMHYIQLHCYLHVACVHTCKCVIQLCIQYRFQFKLYIVDLYHHFSLL